jgi:hypothetical protein
MPESAFQDSSPPEGKARFGKYTEAYPDEPDCRKVRVLAPFAAFVTTSCTVQMSATEAEPFHTVPAMVNTGEGKLVITTDGAKHAITLEVFVLPPPPVTVHVGLTALFTALKKYDAAPLMPLENSVCGVAKVSPTTPLATVAAEGALPVIPKPQITTSPVLGVMLPGWNPEVLPVYKEPSSVPAPEKA